MQRKAGQQTTDKPSPVTGPNEAKQGEEPDREKKDEERTEVGTATHDAPAKPEESQPDLGKALEQVTNKSKSGRSGPLSQALLFPKDSLCKKRIDILLKLAERSPTKSSHGRKSHSPPFRVKKETQQSSITSFLKPGKAKTFEARPKEQNNSTTTANIKPKRST